MPRRISPALWITLIFVGCGLPFLRLSGLHVDASSELTCFYSCSQPVFRPVVFGYEVPLMVLPYLGAFKGWLYQPLLSSLEVTATALRLPLLLAAAVTVYLFYGLLEQVAGKTAALAGTLLLATDTSFVIASSIDFGPVVLLHLFLLAGIRLLLRFERTQARWCLAAAGFLYGLALWHKALFIWLLVGLGVAAVSTLPGRLRKSLSPANLALASASLAIGALPLVAYNLATGGATLRTNQVISAAAPLPQKIRQLQGTIDGSAMPAFLVEDPARPGSRREPAAGAARLSVRLRSSLGTLPSNWLLIALLASIALIPLLGKDDRRAPLFALVYLAVVWLQMAAIPNTGAAVHHDLLLWPFPQFLVAVTASRLAARFGRPAIQTFAAVILLMVARNMMFLNQCAADLVTRGPSAVFTDAVYPLYQALSSIDRTRVAAVDWGYGDTLCLLSDGQLDVHDLSFTLRSDVSPETIQPWLTKRTVFIGRVAVDEQFPGVHARLTQAAEQAGYARRLIQTIADRNGRPRFELLRYVPKDVAGSQ